MKVSEFLDMDPLPWYLTKNHMFLYIIDNGSNLKKIGITSHLKRRLKTICGSKGIKNKGFCIDDFEINILLLFHDYFVERSVYRDFGYTEGSYRRLCRGTEWMLHSALAPIRQKWAGSTEWFNFNVYTPKDRDTIDAFSPLIMNSHNYQNAAGFFTYYTDYSFTPIDLLDDREYKPAEQLKQSSEVVRHLLKERLK